MVSLKPCPFCGREPQIFPYVIYNNLHQIRCECGVVMWEMSEKKVIEKWNKRKGNLGKSGEISPNWHTGVPSEDGDYICAFLMDDGSVEYGWCVWDGQGFDIMCDYNTEIIGWHKFMPHEKDDR